jgi:phage terminase large subunit-like protein
VLLTGKAGGKHGKAPTVTLGDEMHEWVSRELADTLRQGEASLEPIRLYASTAGLKQQGTGYGLWEESLKILDGRVQDTTKLIVIFAAPEDADWTDEETWRLANPSIGLSPTLATLREDCERSPGERHGARGVSPVPAQPVGRGPGALDPAAEVGCLRSR